MPESLLKSSPLISIPGRPGDGSEIAHIKIKRAEPPVANAPVANDIVGLSATGRAM